MLHGSNGSNFGPGIGIRLGHPGSGIRLGYVAYCILRGRQQVSLAA